MTTSHLIYSFTFYFFNMFKSADVFFTLPHFNLDFLEHYCLAFDPHCIANLNS